MSEKKTRNRMGNLMKPMGVAMAHAKLLRRMQNAIDKLEADSGKFDLVAAGRLSQAFQAQRTILETTETETKMAALEERITQIATMGAGNTVVQFKRQA